MADLTADAIDKIAALARKSTFEHLEVSSDRENGEPLHYLVTPDGVKSTDITDAIDKRLPFPRFRRGAVHLTTVESLIAMGQRMREPRSVILADLAQRAIRIVFDFHEAVNVGGETGEMVAATAPQPGHCAFYARLALQPSVAFTAWSGAAGDPMDQRALAAFLEERVGDLQLGTSLQDPSIRQMVERLGISLANPSEVLAFARRANVVVKEQFAQTGDTELDGETSYARTVDLPAALPSAFLIAVPVFHRDAAYQFLVRIRMVRTEKAVQWRLMLPRFEEALEDAFNVTCNRVAAETGIPLFMSAGA